jgi:hypothetical protein
MGDRIVMEENKSDSGASVDSGGDLESKTTDKKEPEKTRKTVPVENHQRALDDMHKFKSRASDLESKLNAIEEERLREKQDFKALADKYKAEAEANGGKLREVNALIERSQKFSTLERVAVEAGIRPEAIDDLESLDLKDLQLETTSNGRFMVNGAKEFVDDLKSRKPHWFRKDKLPTVNPGGGGAKAPGDGKVTPRDVLDAEKKVRAGKMTKDEYHSVFRRYTTQAK